MDAERKTFAAPLTPVQRALTGPVTVTATRQDLLEAGLAVLPRDWTHHCPETGGGARFAASEHGGDAWVWVLRAAAFDEQRWAEALAEFGAQPAQTLVLVLLRAPAHGADLRRVVEMQAFAAGYRKHPAYYLMLDYEALQLDAGPLIVPLEKLPPPALAAYPLQALAAERDLHMDMLRESGERSDAHVVRYRLAADLVRAGDRVLDAACGLGYGSYVLAHLTRCSSVLGVDGSDTAVNYAELNFAAREPRLAFRRGYLPDDLADLADESFDVIVSFETLEHVENPVGLLAEFARLLRPGGRVIVSVPNDWADDSGRDPNPHHLHVYTLDKLRRQFSSHFVRERLYQQIASGCKRRATGNRWAPLPRTLRALPVDTALAPDSEWWILSGSKPERVAQVDLDAPWYAAMRPPWAETARGAPLASGLVLAAHCVPASVDPAVEAFWVRLAAELAQRGQTLVLLSTAAIASAGLNVIEIPFDLTAFPSRYRRLPSAGEAVSERDVLNAVSWYGCDHDTARDSLRLAQEFLADLLETLRPSAVLGWQSLHPVTRVLRDRARAADVPFWSAERGWVRNTLMFDQGDAHALSEANTSLMVARLRERWRPRPDTLQALERRARQAADLGRYRGAERVCRAELRARLGIGADARVVAVFTHGEPGLHAMSASALREYHDTSAELLQARLDAVTDALLARGIWVLVQEHPFNVASGRTMRLRASPQVRAVTENVSSLLDAADHYLFTLATLQFDAVFLDKSFGLLARSALYRAGLPPFIGDYETADAFVDAVLDEGAWSARRQRLCEDVAFLYESLLIDIEPEAMPAGAAAWADHLARFERPIDAGLHDRVERFLQKWSPGA